MQQESFISDDKENDEYDNKLIQILKDVLTKIAEST